jgi:hypothetical protein
VAKEVSDEDTIEQVIARLETKYPDTPRADIESATRAEFEQLAGRPVKDYLAILVERATKKRLKKSAKPGTPS